MSSDVEFRGLQVIDVPPPGKAPSPRPLTPRPPAAEDEGVVEAGEQSSDAIEADDGPPEEDEFLAEGWDANSSSASTSVTSSIYHHAFENGRRYHAYKYGRYPIPNDDLEQSREDMKHALMLELTDGKLFHAPIGENPRKIIDIGTGTGMWAIEMGDQFPSAEILGLDLSPIQPQWVPPNVRFIIDDVEDDWASGSDWGFAHFRSMSMILRDLQKVVDQTYLHLRPGGWIEFQESWGMPFCDDGTMVSEGEDEDIMVRFYRLCADAMARFGMQIDKGTKVGEYLSHTGFTNITCVKRKVPIGTWAKEKALRLVGLYVREATMQSLPSMGKAFAGLGMSEVEREVWAAKVRAAVKDTSVHRYYYFYFWYAQKPE
ncbi:S-adenosyl-L-methionine-dependent methyltransferase [Podospora didyma]|uniref:S-adenosyl-L-methionine-dependent methyltransferase n=1 Tax=Podospora didyma TaxID=330526 RepID=A0AAE0NY67_9PEZI|nr:S-adenosyl-L-methionine-dependent methyltransferase [Podospora didyma]